MGSSMSAKAQLSGGTGDTDRLPKPGGARMTGLAGQQYQPVSLDWRAVTAHQRPDVWILLAQRACTQLAEAGVCGAGQEHHMAADCRQ